LYQHQLKQKVMDLNFAGGGEQPQKPLYTTQAHVFQIDPDTKKSWLPSCKQAVGVSYYYDSSKFIYKIISVENAKILINSTITSAMTFTKTSQKFGQWSDAKNNTVYGLGFGSESDLKKFADKFKEVKNNVRCGTPPSVPKNPANLKNNQIIDPSPATSMKSMSSNSTSSYDEETQSPGSHRSSSSSSESQIKYENDRLKKALAQSSSNAKKWETEFQTLKNNNARLTAALQESAVNVEKWKEQLNNYKEDNQRLRKKLAASVGPGGAKSNSTEVSDLEKRVSELENKLKRKEEELSRITQHSTDELHVLREKNAQLSKKLKTHEDKLSDDANNNRKQNEEIQNYEGKLKQFSETSHEMESKLRELFTLQQKMNGLMKS